MLRVICLWMFSSVAVVAAEDTLPKSAETFEIQGHKAFLYAAPKPAAGKPWVWYAPTLKGVSLVQRTVYFESFLRAGISVAGFDLGEVRGSPPVPRSSRCSTTRWSGAAGPRNRSCSARAAAG